ncbi:member of the major facilitator superfamily [Macrolepiota fuliginosa MF-IS2]|uniref:Member of the major facilitator superfamily n=1 Tax=Macrolepiota fuliginosa MF-IS2 TaxID=1400762 RepID=A0A9P6BYH0_9AGAR|nr:member of the major facilitator superfamily [Macrolepiota fuliginosa MF-IS2]
MAATSDENSPLLGEAHTAAYNGNRSDVSSVEQQVEEPKKISSYLIYVIPMAIGIFLTAMDGTIVVSSYAAIGNDLNELQKTSWIATSYLLTLTSFQPLYGKLSDIFGRKSCLLFAYAIFAVGCLWCGSARSMNELIASRAFAGIGGGGMQTLVSIIMSDLVPLRSRGTWQGIINIVWSCGNTVGASLGGYLADTIGWRWVFYIQFPLAIASALSVYFFLSLPPPPGASGPDADFKTKLRRIDFTGAATLILAIFFLLMGFDRGGDIGWDNQLTLSLLVGFVVFAFAFGLTETRFAAEPFAPTRIILNRSLLASYLVNFFGIAGAFAQLFHISLYLQAVLEKTASETGAWLVIAVVSALLGSLGGGLIMQATGKYYILTCAAYVALLAGTITVLVGTGFEGLPRSTAGVIVGLAITALGNGGGITSSLISLIANAGKADQAIATAVSYLFRSLGSVIGLSIGSTIVQTTLRSVLHRTLHGKDVDEIIRRVRESLDYLNELDPETRVIVRSAYGDAVHSTLLFSVTMALAAMIASWFIVEKPLTR